MQIERWPPQTQYIGQRGGRTLFHGVRLARSLNIEPNLFVTINFWETSLSIRNGSGVPRNAPEVCAMDSEPVTAIR